MKGMCAVCSMCMNDMYSCWAKCSTVYMIQFDNMPIQHVFSVVLSYNNVHEFTNNLLTLYEIKALTRMKSEKLNSQKQEYLSICVQFIV